MKIALLGSLLLLTAACAGKREAGQGRLVVLRFENLSGNPALDWMERGAARQIAVEVSAASAGDSNQRTAERERAIATGARRILHGYVSQSGDRLRLHADLEDAASQKFPQSAEAAGPLSAGLAPLADAVARQIDPGASHSGAKNEAALSALIGGLDASNPEAAAESFVRSIAADPDFGSAYVASLELSMARKDRAASERTLAMARARGDAFSPVDRARFDVIAAQVAGDPAALSKSLAVLSQLTPADNNLLRALAESELAAKRYEKAIEYFKKAVAAQPGDAALLNALGYAQAYAGDLDGAVKSLHDYERVRPAEANPLDSLGDVHFYWGRFPEAEKFYRQAFQKDATFQNGASLLKAATAHLMTGDTNGAEAVFAEYEESRRAANDPLIAYARAQWDYQRGKRAEAARGMGSFAVATKSKEASAIAECAVVVWLLDAGDRNAAAKHNACRFLLDPNAASFPSPVAQVYALLLAKNFERALPILRELATRVAPSPIEPASTLLGWALVETGHFEEAGKYLRTFPVPAAPSPAPFETLVAPRIFYLRAKVAEKRNDRAEADNNNRLFQKLSGPSAP